MTKVFEGVSYNGKRGVITLETEARESGVGMEPSGFSFMNYTYHHTCFFHPYDGSKPVELNAYKVRTGKKFIV